MDICQSDVSHAGGISELRRIAAMAEIYDIGMAPHCPNGPLSFAATLQLGFAVPNFIISEMSWQVSLLGYLTCIEKGQCPAITRRC